MKAQLQITAANIDPALLDLPWQIPLEEWPTEVLAALPRGISRHIVRFVNLNGRVLAVKEISSELAHREYGLLRKLARLGTPSVQPTAVITGRIAADGTELSSALVTEHLQFSLPYRAIFSQSMRAETASRMIDSLAVLLVRLHLLGFYWGDVSLSNTLFRRDAGAFAAYLVDAETGDIHRQLTRGQREYDVELARVNIIGELMDLQAGELIDEEVDVITIGNRIAERYHELWRELTGEERFRADEKWRVATRIHRLNELGFDVGELSISTDIDGSFMRIQPKVVDAGHYHREVMRLTGMDVEEQQGLRMLNDLETFRTLTGRKDQPLELVAHIWKAEIFDPTVQAVPIKLQAKREPAQVFHEVLEHRWYLAEQQHRDIPLPEAVQSYIEHVLIDRIDEKSFLELDPEDQERVGDKPGN